MTGLSRPRFLLVLGGLWAAGTPAAEAYQTATFSGVVTSSDSTRISISGHRTKNQGGAPITLTFLVGPDFTGVTNSDGSPSTMKLADVKPGTQVTVSFYSNGVQTALKLLNVQIFNGLNIPLNVNTFPPH